MRGQISLPQLILQDNGGHTYIEWRTGIDARFGTGEDTVNASVSGTPFSFNAHLEDEIASFVGIDINHRFADSAIPFTLSGELQSTLDGGYAARGGLRATAKF